MVLRPSLPAPGLPSHADKLRPSFPFPGSPSQADKTSSGPLARPQLSPIGCRQRMPDSQPTLFVNPHFRWSSISDRPPSLIQNILLVDHTLIHRKIICDRATDWLFCMVIIYVVDAPIIRLGLALGRVHRKYDANSCGEKTS
jgi:hypothetical protein